MPTTEPVMDYRECAQLIATLEDAMQQLRDVRYCLFALVIAAYVMMIAKLADYYFTLVYFGGFHLFIIVAFIFIIQVCEWMLAIIYEVLILEL